MITLKLIERYGFQMLIDDEHVGDITPSAETEWAVYGMTATGRVRERRIATAPDIFDAIDDLENYHKNKETA